MALSNTTNRTMLRYFAMLQPHREALKEEFDECELAAMADALERKIITNAVTYETLDTIFVGVEEPLLQAVSREDWKIDACALVAKLRKLSFLEKVALVDGVERFWTIVEQGGHPTSDVVLDPMLSRSEINSD